MKKSKYVLKTYHSVVSRNNFNVDEENDEMEWINIEPSFSITSASSGIEENLTLSADERITSITKGFTDKLETLRKAFEETKRKMKRKIKCLQKALKTQKLQHKRQMAALKRKKVSVNKFLDVHHCKNPISRAMVTIQLRRNKRPFTKSEKDFVKRLNYYSSSAYTHMRNAGLELPAPSTVRNWIAEYDIKPGFSDVIYDKLKEKINQLPPEQRIYVDWNGTISPAKYLKSTPNIVISLKA